MGKHRRTRMRTPGIRNAIPAAALFLLGGTALVGAALGVDPRDPLASDATPPTLTPTSGIDPVAALRPGTDPAVASPSTAPSTPTSPSAASPSTAPSTPASPSSASSSSAPAPGSAGDLTGLWSGSLDDPQTESTDARLAVAGPDAEDLSVELPDLGCRYEGALEPDPAGDGATAALRLDGEPREACVDTARIVLRPVADDQVRYDLVESCDGDVCGPREASGVLSRDS